MNPKTVNEYLTMPEATEYARELTGRKNLTRQTVYNWVRVGKLANSGSRIKLRAEVRLQMYTKKDWIKKFIREVNS